MSLGSSGIGASGGASFDRFQDAEQDIIRLDDTTLSGTSTPDQSGDAVLIENCGKCPVLATVNLLIGKGATTPTPRQFWLKPGQTRMFDFSEAVVQDATVEFADETGLATGVNDVDTLTAAAANPATGENNDVIVTWLNS